MSLRILGHGGVIIFLTALTQIGGLAWLAALWFKRRGLSFLLLYAVLWLAAFWVAPLAGRSALPCFGEPLRMQSAFYCLTSRHYTNSELREVAMDAAQELEARFPGTQTLALDASFPFFDGFPLLPHLSHDDGEKLDLAFFYADRDETYLPGVTRSWVGYWAFETPKDQTCPDVFATLRWEMRWLQPRWRDIRLEPARTKALIRLLTRDERVAKLFVEPAFAELLGLSHPKLRFQGCRAARHDDHIHLQL